MINRIMGGSVLYEYYPLLFYKMKIIIFNDTQNFNGSLGLLNKRFDRKNKRFWDYKKYIPFLIEKIKSLDGFRGENMELKKVYFYEGKYSNILIKNFKWSCGGIIKELNQMIDKEQKLLNIISQARTSSKNLRKMVNNHVNNIKEEFESKKDKIIKYIEKQERHFEGQKKLFKELESNPLIDVKTTPLKQKGGEIYQKGVDVLLTTDLTHLAHTEAYDIAIILSGDTDMIEAVKLIKTLGKTPIVVSYHTPGNPHRSNISDLMNVCKFINLKDFTNEEIEKMSDLRKK